MSDLSIWLSFNLFILLMLAVDLFYFHRTPHAVKHREAIAWSVVWIVLALLFCVLLYFTLGSVPAYSFLAGYLVEKSLSVDNLFVFLMLFSYFHVPEAYIHKVLFWGVIGALVMRLLFILIGIYVLATFHWMIYIFGALLIFTGIKMGLGKGTEIHPERNLILRMMEKIFHITPDYEQGQFFIYRNGIYWITPLFIVLIAVETSDIFFAIDSVPAILAITQDPFIAYSSNAFAILGLRALYFALANFLKMFKYFQLGLCALLVFVGVKMLLSGVVYISTGFSLAIIALILTVTIAASYLAKD